MTEEPVHRVIDELEAKLLAEAKKVVKPDSKRRKTPLRKKARKPKS
jgi:hypothetical protein